eukprot:gene7135-12787_t
MARRDRFDIVFNNDIGPGAGTVMIGQNNINLHAPAGPNLSEEKKFEFNEESFHHYMKKAHVVLIHNYKYDSRDEPIREGSDKDATDLKMLFETELAFPFKEFENCSASRIEEIVEMLSQRDFSANDGFVFIFLGHGKKEGLVGTDEKVVSISEITSSFTVDRCPSLGDKPKIFIFQACRGDKCDLGAFAADAEPMENTPLGRTLPVESDFLICYACPVGFSAFRDLEMGSWFIQSFIFMTKKYRKEEHLMDILLRVNFDVASKTCDDRFKQIPSQECRLTKRCYFAS